MKYYSFGIYITGPKKNRICGDEMVCNTSNFVLHRKSILMKTIYRYREKILPAAVLVEIYWCSKNVRCLRKRKRTSSLFRRVN